MEIWDGYNRDGSLADIQLIRGEAIPDGIYHLVCEVIVQHEDGEVLLMKRDLNKPSFPGFLEASAGGSALAGEDKIECITRELEQETGIIASNFTEIGRYVYDDDQCIFHCFHTKVSCQKDTVTLQKSETIAYKWVTLSSFLQSILNGELIEGQVSRLQPFLQANGVGLS